MILEHYDYFYVILRSTLCYEMPDRVPIEWRHCVKGHAIEISVNKNTVTHVFYQDNLQDVDYLF